MNGQTKYDYPPQPSQVTGDFLIMKNFFLLIFLYHMEVWCKDKIFS